ncbi:plasmid recombination protein [Butyrivibrio sp. INlla14]|uniref:plasmid recombination protein n=1 Tax=Butyrivibrio sp. INlla14 TaxID=1520808 RepID=UPI00087647DC|nr:plasmid recombination protein [Butyrivibrio sp. INlla14]SCX96620.1 Plasmid recombination enzyme [Butyrivibrio sp. INlla14]
MRCSRHNGRVGKNGSYNPKHNDREFDVEQADNIDPTKTPYNVYWNCFDRELVLHKDRPEDYKTFTEVETDFYDLLYKDYLEGQSNRYIKSGHANRCKTMEDIRKNKRTCPEETIYQIGNIDESVSYDELLKITVEFLNAIQEKYGEHMHILNWALHVDEGTPHIHERHVFDVFNEYGERQPKQEQALKEMGIDLPDPDKKPSKFNNRKMKFDDECRKTFIEICKKHGLTIEEEPIYGGRQYLEKQDYIIQKQNATIAESQEKFEAVNSKYEELLAENKRLAEKNDNLEIKIEDMEGLVKEVSDIAYNKACDVLVDEIIDKTQAEDLRLIKDYKRWVESDECKLPKKIKPFVAEHLNKVASVVAGIKKKVISKIRKSLLLPEKRQAYTKEIVEEAQPSILELLKKTKKKIDEADKSRPQIKSINRGKEEIR